MQKRGFLTLVILAGWCVIAPPAAWAGLVSGPSARVQFEGFRDGPTADTFIDFNSFAAGTNLTTQVSGVTFSSNIGTSGETPFGPFHVEVSSALGGLTIVGTPCGACADDGRVGYQIVFTTAQRRAGLQRIWNSLTVTRFYNEADQLLAEYTGSGFVGFIADGPNSATDWVKRIQIDGLIDPGDMVTRQVGYSDDLFFGSAEASQSATFTPLLRRGWNLMGNSLELTLNVVTLFGSPSAPVTDVTTHVNSIWKWSATLGIWQFYAPSLTAAENQTFADTNGFEVLASIEPGLGYWVNLKNAAPVGGVTLPAQTGAPVIYESADPIGGTPAKIAGRNLVAGWQLVAIADAHTPSQFNENLSGTPPQPGAVKLSFQSLWAWDALLGTWYFYAPQLHKDGEEQNVGLALVQQYALDNGFLHFEDYTKTLGVGTGFWMRK